MKRKKTVEKLQDPETHLPGQEKQQSPRGMEGSEHVCWQGMVSQLTSPSWGAEGTHGETQNIWPAPSMPPAASYASSGTRGKVLGQRLQGLALT